MRIIVDAMGGDNAPESAVWGGALAAKEYGEEVLLVGKPEVVANVLKEKGLSDVKGITIMPANDLVDMHDDPATVLRHKPDSSMAVAFKLLKAGEGDASSSKSGLLLWHQKHANLMLYAVLAAVSDCYPPLKGRLLTRYSPVRH